MNIKNAIKELSIENHGDENLFLISQEVFCHKIPYDIQYDGFILVLITHGNASFCIGNETLTLQKQDFLILKQQFSIEQSTYSKDIEFKAVYISKKFAEELLIQAHIRWSLYSSFDTYFKTTFTQEETEILCLYFDILQKRILGKFASKNPLVPELLRQVFIYDILSILEPYFGTSVRIAQNGNNSILDNFMKLISNTNPTPRKVGWYAQKLNITAKYLSTFCHKKLGKTPREIIITEIYRKAVDLLHNSNYTINQISETLGFSNQSHFGTFMRRIGGISPKELRKRRDV